MMATVSQQLGSSNIAHEVELKTRINCKESVNWGADDETQAFQVNDGSGVLQDYLCEDTANGLMSGPCGSRSHSSENHKTIQKESNMHQLACDKNKETLTQNETSLEDESYFEDGSMDEDLAVYNVKALTPAELLILKDAHRNSIEEADEISEGVLDTTSSEEHHSCRAGEIASMSGDLNTSKPTSQFCNEPSVTIEDAVSDRLLTTSGSLKPQAGFNEENFNNGVLLPNSKMSVKPDESASISADLHPSCSSDTFSLHLSDTKLPSITITPAHNSDVNFASDSVTVVKIEGITNNSAKDDSGPVTSCEEMSLPTNESKIQVCSSSPATDKTQKPEPSQLDVSLFSDDDFGAFEGFVVSEPQSHSSSPTSALGSLGGSGPLKTFSGKPVRHRRTLKRLSLRKEGKQKVAFTNVAQGPKWMKVTAVSSKAPRTVAVEAKLPRQRQEMQSEADPEYRPSTRHSVNGKVTLSTLSKRKRNCKKQSSQRPLFTLNNWSAITSKVRQSLRVPKFKVNHDFVTWGDSNPAYLLQRRPPAVDELDKTSVVERFTRTLELIARDEQVLLKAASDGEQLQRILHPPPLDDPFVPAPKDSELDNGAASDGSAVALHASQVKCSILTPQKAIKCHKYPIYTPPPAPVVAARRDGFARWAALSDVKVSLNRSALLASTPAIHNGDSLESAQSRRINVDDCDEFEVDRKQDCPGKINTENKIKVLTKDTSTDCSSVRTVGTSSGVMQDFGSKSCSTSPENLSEAPTLLRRSTRAHKVKKDENFITWTEPTHEPPAGLDATVGSYEKFTQGSCDDTRLTLRRTGSQYEVVHSSVPRKRQRLNARQCSSACSFTPADTTDAEAESDVLAARCVARRGSDIARTEDEHNSTLNANTNPHTSICVGNDCRAENDVGDDSFVKNGTSVSKLSAPLSGVVNAAAAAASLPPPPPSSSSMRLSKNSDVSIKDKRKFPSLPVTIGDVQLRRMSTSSSPQSSTGVLAKPAPQLRKLSPTLTNKHSTSVPNTLAEKHSVVSLASDENIHDLALYNQNKLKMSASPSNSLKSSLRSGEQQSRCVSSSSSEVEHSRRFSSSMEHRQNTTSTSSGEQLCADESISPNSLHESDQFTSPVGQLRTLQNRLRRVRSTPSDKSVPIVRRSARARRVSVKLCRDGLTEVGILRQILLSTGNRNSDITIDNALPNEEKTPNVSENVVGEMIGRHDIHLSQKRRRVEKEISRDLDECHTQICASSSEISTLIGHTDENQMTSSSCSASTQVDGSPCLVASECAPNCPEGEGSNLRRSKGDCKGSSRIQSHDITSETSSLTTSSNVQDVQIFNTVNCSDDSKLNASDSDRDMVVNESIVNEVEKKTCSKISSSCAADALVTTSPQSNCEGEVQLKNSSEHMVLKSSVVVGTSPDEACSNVDCRTTNAPNLPRKARDIGISLSHEDTDDTDDQYIVNNSHPDPELPNMSFAAAVCYTYEGDSLVQADAADAFIEPLDSFTLDRKQSLPSLDGFSKVIPPDALNAQWPLSAVVSSDNPDDVDIKFSSSVVSPTANTNSAEKLCSPAALFTSFSRRSTERELPETSFEMDRSSPSVEKAVTDAAVRSEKQLFPLLNAISTTLCRSQEVREPSLKEIFSEDQFESLNGTDTFKHSNIGSLNSKTCQSTDKDEQNVVTEVQSCEVGQSLLPENVSSPDATTGPPQPSDVHKASRKPRPRTLFCDRCPYRSRALSYFAIHKSQHAEEEKRNPSPADAKLSDLIFDGSAVSHLTNVSSLLRCPSCTYATVFKASFTLHRKHHEKFTGTPSYACPFCIHFTFSKVQLAEHIQAQHGDQSNSSTAVTSTPTVHSSASAASTISEVNSTSESRSSVASPINKTDNSNLMPSGEKISSPECSENSSLTLHHCGANNSCDSVDGEDFKNTGLQSADDLNILSIIDESKISTINDCLPTVTPELMGDHSLNALCEFDDEGSNDFDGFPDVQTPSRYLLSKLSDKQTATESLAGEIFSPKGDSSCSDTLSRDNSSNNHSRKVKTVSHLTNAVVGHMNKTVCEQKGVRRHRRHRKFAYKQRKCPYCEYRCRYVSQYCAHLCKHEDYVASQELLDQAITEPVVPQGVELQKCCKCRFATNVSSALTRHMRFHSECVEDQLGEVTSQKSEDEKSDNKDVSQLVEEEGSDNGELLSEKGEGKATEDGLRLIDLHSDNHLFACNSTGSENGTMVLQVDEGNKITSRDLLSPKSNTSDSTVEGKQISEDIADLQRNWTSSLMESNRTDENHAIGAETLPAAEVKLEENVSNSSVTTGEDLEHNSDKVRSDTSVNEISSSSLACSTTAETSISPESFSISIENQGLVQQEFSSAVSCTEMREAETMLSSPHGLRIADSSSGQPLNSNSCVPDQAPGQSCHTSVRKHGLVDCKPTSETCVLEEEKENASFHSSVSVTEPLSPVRLCLENCKAVTSFRRRKKSQTSTSACRILKRSSRFRRSKKSVAETVERVLSRVLNKPSLNRSHDDVRTATPSLTERDGGLNSPSSSARDFSDDRTKDCGAAGSHTLKESNTDTHSDEKQCFNCEHCHFETDSQVVFSYHMRKHAPKNIANRSESCPYCNFKSNKSYLKRHIALHTGDNLYQCPHCSYKTALSKSYREHVNNHRGKKYSCSQCPYSTAYETCYKRHVVTHDSTNLMHCGHRGCKFSTFRADVLRMHRATHVSDKKFKCSLCSYQTSASYMLKLHMKRHTGEGLLKCPYCTFATAKRINLHNHVRIHTGQGRLDCEVDGCDYFCFRSAYYRRHLLKHHGMKEPKAARTDDL